MQLVATWSSAFSGGAKASLGAISEWGAASGNAHRLSSQCLRCIADGGPVRPEPGAVHRSDVLGKSPLTVGRPWLVRINAVCGPRTTHRFVSLLKQVYVVGRKTACG